MRDASCISDQDMKDFFAGIDVQYGLDAENAVKQLSDKAIIQLQDSCERELNRKLHDRRMTKNRDRETRRLLEAISVLREDIVRRYRTRIYEPSSVPRIRIRIDQPNVVQFPFHRDHEPAK